MVMTDAESSHGTLLCGEPPTELRAGTRKPTRAVTPLSAALHDQVTPALVTLNVVTPTPPPCNSAAHLATSGFRGHQRQRHGGVCTDGCDGVVSVALGCTSSKRDAMRIRATHWRTLPVPGSRTGIHATTRTQQHCHNTQPSAGQPLS